MGAIRLGSCSMNMGLGAAQQLTNSKYYLIASTNFNWFNFLVFFDLYYSFHYFIPLYLIFNNSLKFPENNSCLVHNNTIKIKSKFEQ